MWNDTDIPLAYLITFRCYGTWLHGDKRGSIDRFHNAYKSPYIEANPQWHRHNAQALEGEPVILDARRRTSVERAIRETCQFRKWHLRAVSVRTNHVHVVVCIGASGKGSTRLHHRSTANAFSLSHWERVRVRA